jgi:hypothetical protein
MVNNGKLSYLLICSFACFLFVCVFVCLFVCLLVLQFNVMQKRMLWDWRRLESEPVISMRPTMSRSIELDVEQMI